MRKIAYALSLLAALVSSRAASAQPKPIRADRGVQIGAASSWNGSTGTGGIYYKTGVGLVARNPDNTETVLGEGSVFSARSYGAVCDGITDDSTALQAAINAAKANGGLNNRGATVLLPKGQCKFSTPLNLQASYGVRIVGQGGVAPGSPKPSTVLLYTGTGSTPAIQMNAAIGTQFLDVGILYNSASFTGILIDFSQGALGSGGAYALIQRCTIGGNINDTLNAFGASSLISFDNMIDSQVQDSILRGGVEGIHLRDSNTHFANGIVISGNVFSDFSTAAITNGATNDVVTGNVFENNPGMVAWNATHPGAFPTMAPAFAYTASMAQYALVFTNNYVGDGDYSTYAFSTTNSTQYGLVFEGNYFLGNIQLAAAYGSSISKNTFTSVRLDFVTATPYDGVTIANNGMPGGTGLTFTNQPTSGVTVLGNRSNVAANNVADVSYMNGTLVNGQGVASAGATTMSSGSYVLRGSYWNGSASVNRDVTLSHIIDSTGPTSHAAFSLAGTEMLRFDASAVFAVQGTMKAGLGGTGTVNAATVTPGGSGNMAICTTNCTGFTVTGPLQVGLPAKANNTIASAATVAPTGYISHITGTTTIATITAPASFAATNSGGCIVLVFDAVAPWSAAGNILVAGTPTTAGTSVQFCYDPATVKWYPSRTL